MNTDNDNLTAFEFKELQQSQFMIVNDDVMGGLSKSELSILDDRASFVGNISLQNNGGFTSVRMMWPFAIKTSNDQPEPTLAVLKVKGDGKIYQFRLRTNQGFDGAAYSHSFKTLNDQVQTIYIPINDFIPSFRGQTLTDMPKLKFSDVQQMGVMIANKQVGGFNMDMIELSLK